MESFINEKFFRKWFKPNLLWLIIIVGIAVRFVFQTGHIFSDDAYYSYLSYSLLEGSFTDNYLGYPVFPLRIGQISLTAFAFRLFGISEFATLVFPFLFSIINLILVYKLTFLLTKESGIALIATFLTAFFPTDIMFATINFPDLINVFFINLGIYFLLKSYLQNSRKTAIWGGIFLFLSMQFKENIYYISILLGILLIYVLVKHKYLNFQILVALIFIGLNTVLEGFIYLIVHNDLFYRLTITNLNYQFSYYDFFPYTAQKFSGSKNYIKNLFDQIFLVNGKSIFLRRFYLFIPIIASIQSFVNKRKKENLLLNLWFFGIAVLMIAFTTSFTEYKPLDLQRSWYIYPLVMPMIILSAQFIARFKRYITILLLIIYTLGSLIMCHHYESYFNSSNLNSLKTFLTKHPNKKIFTDHFTKYSIDLIRRYKKLSKSERILGDDFNFDKVKSGNWILYNKKHIDELRMQKYKFPDFSVLKNNNYKQVAVFSEFIFYEKVIQ